MIGTTCAHYRITAKVGEGGMGAVYLAEDTKLQREVALWVVPGTTAADPERLERFEREARSIAALNHPNIVMIHSVEKAAATHLLTMELVNGQSLGRLLPPAGFDLDPFWVALPRQGKELPPFRAPGRLQGHLIPRTSPRRPDPTVPSRVPLTLIGLDHDPLSVRLRVGLSAEKHARRRLQIDGVVSEKVVGYGVKHRSQLHEPVNPGDRDPTGRRGPAWASPR